MIGKDEIFEANNNSIINCWLHIPNSFTAEAISKMGWDSVTIDMQHGHNDYITSIPMIQTISNNNVPCFVRVPWNEPGIIMKTLDLGVSGIIAPMINNKKDCEKFISYCYYPPIGQRSFGPLRAGLVSKKDYYENANSEIVSFAMVETKEAVENIDEILSVPNLTGIYIGPGDLCSSYGYKPQFDIKNDPLFSIIKMVCEKTLKANKIPGIHNGSTKYTKEMINLGFRFLTISSDFRFLSTYAESIIQEMKNINQKKSENKTY